MKYKDEVEQLRGKVSAITSYVSNLQDKVLLESENYLAIACADFISNTLRAFDEIVERCEEDK